MPNIIKKLDFTTQTDVDPYLAVPTGWEYSVGSKQGRTYNISAVSVLVRQGLWMQTAD